MLTKVHFQNFRLCADTALDNLGKVVALIGQNGAGKSNILQGIALVAETASSARDLSQILFDAYRARPLMATFEFECQNSTYRYHLEFTTQAKFQIRESLHRIHGAESEEMVVRDGSKVNYGGPSIHLEIGVLFPCLPAIAAILPPSEPIVGEVKGILNFLSTIRYYPIDEPNKRHPATEPVIGSQYRAWVTKYESSGDPGELVLFKLIYMYERQREDFAVLVSLLGPDGLGLIERISITPTPAENEELYFVGFDAIRGDSVPSIDVNLEQLSVGTRRVLRMLVSMIFDRSAVFLLEQPEDSLHQGLTKKLIGLIENNVDAQLIMASHSSALLNELQPQDIRLVSLQDGFTTVRALTDRERDAAAKFMNEEGPLYDFLEPLQ